MQSYYVRKTFTRPDGYRERMYNADACDLELTRLRERVAELERQVTALTPNFQDAVQLSEAWEERESLLLECLRWCLENGAKHPSYRRMQHKLVVKNV